MPKHSPATPLPWRYRNQQWDAPMTDAVLGPKASDGGDYAPIGQHGPDAAYIVHAANAYPRLVARVFNNLLAHSLVLDEDDMTDDTRMIHCTCQQCGANHALLRELGEE